MEPRSEAGYKHLLAVTLRGPVVPFVVGLWLLCEQHLVETAERNNKKGRTIFATQCFFPLGCELRGDGWGAVETGAPYNPQKTKIQAEVR